METIQNLHGVAKWHWYSVMEDLKVQGGLEGVVIDPFSVHPQGCGGVTSMGTRFFITWVPNTFLLLSMTQEEQELVEAFAKVVEYRPFCRYLNEPGFLTFEWDKTDPAARLKVLSAEGARDLQRLGG